MRTINKTVLSVALGLTLAVGLSVPAQADILYGLTTSNPGASLYTINTSTGAATHFVNLSGVAATNLVDLAALNGTLYASDVIANSGPLQFQTTFGSINPTTGAYTAINNQNGSSNWQSLAADPAKNLFYTVNNGGAGAPLLSVTPGGAITNIGFTNTFLNGLTFDSNHNILYGVDRNNLYKINTTTGAATLVGPKGFSNDLEGIAYDNATNTLYLNTGTDFFNTISSNNNLYTLNTATGAATLVGANGPVFVPGSQGIDGIALVASVSTPEPSSVTLLGIGAVSLVAGWWRRRKPTEV
jgi:hypothetical protein